VIATGLAALVGSFALGAVALQSAHSMRANEPPADARARGRMIRRAIEQAYWCFPGGITTAWGNASSFVEPSLPAGLSYDLAEESLWQAGFDFIWARRTTPKPMDEYLKRSPTLAVMRQLILWPIGKLEIAVTVVPARRTNFQTVERTSAFIRFERWI
jgi:hypothetical protein